MPTTKESGTLQQTQKPIRPASGLSLSVLGMFRFICFYYDSPHSLFKI